MLEEMMPKSSSGQSSFPRPRQRMPLWGEFRRFWAMTPAMQMMLGGSEQVEGKGVPSSQIKSHTKFMLLFK